MTAIAAQGFGILWRDGPGCYIVTIDGWYNRGFAAADDADAIRQTGWHIPTY
jgi:hypothetical protein